MTTQSGDPVYADTRVMTPEGLTTVRPRVSLRALRDGEGNTITDTYQTVSGLDEACTALGYVKEAGGGATVVVSESEPDAPTDGMIWYRVIEVD